MIIKNTIRLLLYLLVLALVLAALEAILNF
jgi:hypothetical protein